MTDVKNGFDELRLKITVGNSEYEVAVVKFPFPWWLTGKETVMIELYHGKGADLKPRKVAATKINFQKE